LHGKGAQSIGFEDCAGYHNSRNANPIHDFRWQLNSVLCGENDIKLASLIGNKHHRRARGNTQFRAEGVIVRVDVKAKETVCICEFAAKMNRLSIYDLSDFPLNVALLGHLPSVRQVRNESLHSREWHVVHSVSIAELK
jgi:hypothetical protein